MDRDPDEPRHHPANQRKYTVKQHAGQKERQNFTFVSLNSGDAADNQTGKNGIDNQG